MKFEQETLTLSQKKPRERANKPKDGDQNIDDKNEFSAEENSLFNTASDLIKQRRKLKSLLSTEKEEIKKEEIKKEIQMLADSFHNISHILYEQRNKLISLLHAEKEETKKEKIRRKIETFHKKEELLDKEYYQEREEKSSNDNYKPISNFSNFKISEEERKKMEQKINEIERARKEYEDNYIPSFSELGFEEGKLEKPPKWQPQENQKEEQLVNQAEFNAVEMIGGAITDEGDIKNGSTYFRELFHDKISAILGEKFADSCVDNNYYIPLKEEEIQNDLAEFINNLTDSKDIEKIIALKFIKDISYDSFDEEGEYHFNTFAMSSLLNRFKDEDVSILEKYFIKDTLHKVIEIRDGSPYSSGWEIESEKIIKKKKDFLKKEFGQISRPENYHNNNFNKFRFQFTESQREILFSQKPTIFQEPVFYEGQDPKPVNYYKDSRIKIPSDHLIGVYDIECYISSPITPEVIGIYTEDGTLIGWKRIDDLKEKQDNLINNVNEIKSEIGDISIDDLILFKTSSSLGFRSYIQETLAIDLSTVNIKNQLYFLNFIQGKTEEELSRFREFIKKSKDEQGKVNKLKTFLSIEQGGKEMGDKILALGKKLPEDIAHKVFGKYAEIIDQADALEDFIRNNFSKDLLENNDLIEKIRDKILNRAKDILVSISGKIGGDIDVNQINGELDNIQTSKEILVSTIKMAKKSNINLTLENILSFDLQKISPLDDVWMANYALKEQKENLSEEEIKRFEGILDDVKQIEEMYKKNYSDNPDLQEYLVDEFHNFIYYQKDKLEKGYDYANSEVNILKYKGKVVSFDRFDPKTLHSRWHFRSFNTEKDFQCSGVGSLMLKATLDKKILKNETITAECSAMKPVASFYIEGGFIATEFFNFKNEPGLSIIRDDREIYREFKTKSMGKEDILKNIGLPEGTIVEKFMKQDECDFNYIIPMNYATDQQKKNASLNEYYHLPEKYVLTRYFFDEDSKQWVTVFETTKRDLKDFL